jgi:hypothetical protein
MNTQVESSHNALHCHQPESHQFITTAVANTTWRWRRPMLSKLRRKPIDPPESGMQRKRRPVNSTSSHQSLTIVVISDLHELHRQVEIPDGDLLLCCGDWTMFSQRQISGFNQVGHDNLESSPKKDEQVINETLLRTGA